MYSKYDARARFNSRDLEPDHDYDPYEERYLKKPLKNWEAYNLLIRGCLNTGVLLLPEAFRCSGILVGIVDIIIISIFTTYMYHLMMKARLTLCKILRVGRLFYPQAMHLGFETGPSCLRVFSPVIGFIVDFLCFINQLNFLCSYLWYMAHDLKRILERWHDYNMPFHSYVLFLAPYTMVVLCVNNLKIYAVLAVVSNVLTLVSIIFLVYYLVLDLPNFTLVPPSTEPSEHVLFIIPAFFALQSMPLTSTIELNVMRGHDFLKPRGILCQSYATLSILYIIVGVLGYWRYEEKTVFLTENLDVLDWAAQIAIILYFFGVHIAYGLQGLIGIYVVWEHHLTSRLHFKFEFMKDIIEYVIFRFILFVAVPVIIVIYLHVDFSIFLMVHGICVSFLSVIFPALLDISVRWKYQKFGMCYIIFMKDILLVVLGLLLLAVSYYHGYRFFIGHPGAAWW